MDIKLEMDNRHHLTGTGNRNNPNSSYVSSSNWTREENKQFERALAIFDKETPDRWIDVAKMIPGKSVFDVYKQYAELEDDVSCIEAGLVPVPGYNATPSFTLDWVDDRGFDSKLNKGGAAAAAAAGIARSLFQERKKGVPWTEDEHRKFLLGLMKHGKGDWRNISRNFVGSKTATQVASHAQKYFNRLNSGAKEKRRPSIHDMTTNNLGERHSSNNAKMPPAFNHYADIYEQHIQHNNLDASARVVLDWNDSNNSTGGGNMVFKEANLPSSYSSSALNNMFQGQHMYNAPGGHHQPYIPTFTRYRIRG